MKRLLVCAAIALLLAGCGGIGDGQASDGATNRTEQRVPPPIEPSDTETSETPEPYAPNVGETALTIGEVREGQSVTTTLFEVRNPMPPELYRDPAAGNVFVGLRIEQCLKEMYEDPYSTYNGEWSILTPGGQEYAGSGSSWDDWPAPKFPETVTMTEGRCLKGWIATEVPEGTRISGVVYRPAGVTVAEWLPDGGGAVKPASADAPSGVLRGVALGARHGQVARRA